MCLDTEKHTCCCGCSLTAGTWILGVLIAINMIVSLIFSYWFQAVFEGLLLIPFILTLFNKHRISFRKILYYVYLISMILWIIATLIVVIFVAVYPDSMRESLIDQCIEEETLQDYFDHDIPDCADTLHKWILATIILVFIIGIPINLLFTRMLYYGWKEQEEYHRQRAAIAQGLQPAAQQAQFYQPVNQMA